MPVSSLTDLLKFYYGFEGFKNKLNISNNSSKCTLLSFKWSGDPFKLRPFLSETYILFHFTMNVSNLSVSSQQSCEAILKMMTLGSSLITTNCLQVFYSLFSAKPNLNVMPASLNAQLINALYDYQPSTSDSQTTQAWLLVLQEGFINLSK